MTQNNLSKNRAESVDRANRLITTLNSVLILPQLVAAAENAKRLNHTLKTESADTKRTELSEEPTPNKHVLEIEIAFDEDHATHENTLKVLLIGDLNRMKDAYERAGEIALEKYPNLKGAEASALYCGSEPLESAEYRQFIDERIDNVIVGPEVPV